MTHYGTVTNHFLGRVVLLWMNAPNLALYNTHGVGDKGGNTFSKIYYLYILFENIENILLFYMYTPYYLFWRRKFIIIIMCYYYVRQLFIYKISEATIAIHQFARPIPLFAPWATNMSNFRHRTIDSLRDKLQTLPIFVLILYQMDKPSGICIMSPNTKAYVVSFYHSGP
jgi:hypothetical protein